MDNEERLTEVLLGLSMLQLRLVLLFAEAKAKGQELRIILLYRNYLSGKEFVLYEEVPGGKEFVLYGEFRPDKWNKVLGSRIPENALVEVVRFMPRRRVLIAYDGELINTMLWCISPTRKLLHQQGFSPIR